MLQGQSAQPHTADCLDPLKFGPPEYFPLMIMGLTILTFLASGPMWKALLTASSGVFLGCMGMDMVMGTTRFTFDIVELQTRLLGLRAPGSARTGLRCCLTAEDPTGEIEITIINKVPDSQPGWVLSRSRLRTRVMCPRRS